MNIVFSRITTSRMGNQRQNVDDSQWNSIDVSMKSDNIMKFENSQQIQQGMKEESEHQFQAINCIWPDVNHQSSNQECIWSQDPHGNESNNRLTDLHKTKEKFKTFVKVIGELRKTSIRTDVLKYCEAQSKKEKSLEVHYKPETILKKMQVRIEKMIKTKRIKRNWGEQDIKILLWVVSKYCDWKGYENIQKQLEQEDWNFIAQLIPGATGQACMFKWLSLKKTNLSINSWSDQQSHLLSLIVKQRNNKGNMHNSEIHDWKEISQELYKLNIQQDKVYRNAKQCREHWSCFLSPQLKKGPWQMYEDERLFKFVQANNGAKKWSEISKHFEGRTENALKNRYMLILEKQRKLCKDKNKTELQIVNEYLQKCYIEQYTSQKQEDYKIYEQSELMKKEIKWHQKTEEEEKSKPLQKKFKNQKINESIYRPSTHVLVPSIVYPSKLMTEKKLEQIFEQQQKPHNYQSHIKSSQSTQSNSSTTTINTFFQTVSIKPIKVQMLKFKDFAKFGLQNFRRKIQPGVMDAAGQFKKTDNIVTVMSGNQFV